MLRYISNDSFLRLLASHDNKIMKQKREYLQPYLRDVITVMASGRNAYSKSSQSAKSGAQSGFKQKSKHMANTDEWQVACRL